MAKSTSAGGRRSGNGPRAKKGIPLPVAIVAVAVIGGIGTYFVVRQPDESSSRKPAKPKVQTSEPEARASEDVSLVDAPAAETPAAELEVVKTELVVDAAPVEEKPVSAPVVASSNDAGNIWVEGEAPSKNQMTRHPWWYDKVKTGSLSEGNFISNWNGERPGTASYEFDVEEAGSYVFWVRANPLGAKLSYRLGDAEWTQIDLDKNKRGEMNIAEDSKPDMRFIAWSKVGKVSLDGGPATIHFKMHSENNNHGYLDCFLFTKTGFVPSGVAKPSAGSAGSVAKAEPADPSDAIWIEGEAPSKNQMNRHPWWYDKVKRASFSGEDMISNFSDEKEGTAEYEFDVIESDSFTFWIRANPLRAKLSYKMDGGDWQPIDMEKSQRGNMNVAEDSKPDLRFIAWAKVGKLRLEKGKHAIAFRMNSENSNHGYIDCFTFVRIPFVPSGVNKPFIASAGSAGPGDWFPAVFDEDEFSAASVIDMTKYVEAPAGKHGFLKRDGASLRFEKARQAIQFWGCGANIENGQSREDMTQRIRYLRKHGVNMVRQHPLFSFLGPLRGGKIDAEKLDRWDWWFAELKKHGIYMTWSVFYPHHQPMISAEDGYDLYDELKKDNGLGNIGGLINIERGIQDICLKYLTAILSHKNPYTGLAYRDDPALAVLEIQNEDCVFFHVPLNELRDPKVMPKHSARFRKMWGSWLKKQYASADELKQAWGGLRADDSWEGGEFEVMGAYHLGGEGPLYEFEGQVKRAGDYIHFLTDLQKSYFDRREKEMRGLGFKGVTVTTAWRAGGAAADPANLYCDTACDMIDRHNYFGGGDGGHGITEGKVEDVSHLSKPGSGLLSLGMYQVKDRPFAITEWSMMPPNQWKLEAAPLYAFYGMGLQGWDASYHFLNSRKHPGDGWPGSSKYCTDTPHYIGQFPALSFAVRHGHIKEAPVVALRRLSQADLYRGTDALRQDFTGGGHDIKTIKSTGLTPMEALAIGRVTVDFDDGEDELVDLSKYWDDRGQVIRSMTGELEWDYSRQVVTLSAPKTQAVVGRAGGSTFELPGVRAEVKTEFVSLVFTPLDDAELASSKHVLITAMARDKQTGSRYGANGKSLEVLGAPPLLMEPVQATLKFKGAKPSAVNVLDLYGVPTGQTVEVGGDGTFAIDGRYRTYYYEVKR